MRLILINALLFLPFVNSFAQVDTTELRQEIKNELIYLQIEDQTMNVYAVQTMNGLPVKKSLSDQIRKVHVYFKKGTDSTAYTPLIPPADNFRQLIDGDVKAIKQFDKALSCEQQGRNSRLIWKSAQIVTIGTLAAALLIYIQSNSSGLPVSSIILLGAAAASYGTLGVFYFRSNRKSDHYIEYITQCVQIYNENIITSFE